MIFTIIQLSHIRYTSPDRSVSNKWLRRFHLRVEHQFLLRGWVYVIPSSVPHDGVDEDAVDSGSGQVGRRHRLGISHGHSRFGSPFRRQRFAWIQTEYVPTDATQSYADETGELSDLVMVSGAIEQFCLHEIVANTQFHKLYSVENRLHPSSPKSWFDFKTGPFTCIQGYAFNHLFNKRRKRNRIELISDFPTGNDAEVIASLQVSWPHTRIATSFSPKLLPRELHILQTLMTNPNPHTDSSWRKVRFVKEYLERWQFRMDMRS